jgi:hypothetical protein
MFNRYRKWKHVLVPPLVALGLILMSGEPEESARWYAGIAIVALLGAAYLIEEMAWMARNQGRPCDSCGRAYTPRAFRLSSRCPHCGQVLQ